MKVEIAHISNFVPTKGNAALQRSSTDKFSDAGLRVVHVVEAGQGGIETAVRLLIEAQANDDLIEGVHLLADSARLGSLLRDSPARLHLYQSSRRPMSVLKTSRNMQRSLADLAPDVVYLHSTFPGVYGRLFQRKNSVPWKTIYCSHGWAFTQKVSAAKRHAYLGIERVLAPRADAIVSISSSEFEAATDGGLQHDRHEVILHGVPAAAVTTENKVQFAKDKLNLVFVGRYDRQKGLDLLVKAWRDVRLADVHLWIIGDATLPDAVVVEKQDNVHCLGWIPNTDIDAYIQSSDGMIVPSRWEGFGLVALEAMRNGKAVLASRVGGLNELVQDGSNGFFIDPEDTDSLIEAILKLDKNELARMGDVAKSQFEEKFSWETCYGRWRALMVQLADIGKGKSKAATSTLGATARKTHLVVKRGLDILVSFAALFFLSPFLLLIALVVKLTSPGPVLFGNERIGQHGRHFRAWKFRSMVPDSTHVLEDFFQKNPDSKEHFEKFHKLPNDPRVTRFGRFLRKTSLDELPQLLNILFGDMSLVGPRPIVLDEVERYMGAYDLYLSVQPGLTGLWQVSGRNRTTFAERVAFDEYYVRNWSMWLDLQILARTARVVFFAEGAY